MILLQQIQSVWLDIRCIFQGFGVTRNTEDYTRVSGLEALHQMIESLTKPEVRRSLFEQVRGATAHFPSSPPLPGALQI